MSIKFSLLPLGLGTITLNAPIQGITGSLLIDWGDGSQVEYITIIKKDILERYIFLLDDIKRPYDERNDAHNLRKNH